MRHHRLFEAQPNAAHDAVTRLWEAGWAAPDVDGLHRAAGLPSDALVELTDRRPRPRCRATVARTPS
jgi:NAD-dependent SIR2 family protein deacetylase